MLIKRKLKVGIEDAIELFQGTRWKFVEVLDQDNLQIEVKRKDELLVVELPNKAGTLKKLKTEGFIEIEKTRIVS